MVKTSLLMCCKNSSLFLITAILLSMPAFSNEDVVKIVQVNEPGENTYVNYEVNNGKLMPKYYQFTINDAYGDVENHNSNAAIYYKWDNSKGYNTLVKGTVDDHDIKYYINNRPIAGEIMTNAESGVDINLNFENFNIKTPVLTINGEVDNLTADFVNNITDRTTSLLNNGYIKNIAANYASNSGGNWDVGSAINNYGTIDNITGVFIGNSAVKGIGNGTISNWEGHIGSINGIFIGNENTGIGSAVFNATGTIDSIDGVFIGNRASTGTVTSSEIETPVNKIHGVFINNSANRYGAVYAMTPHVSGDFIYNTAGYAGAVGGRIDYIEGNFIGNSANDMGAIFLFDAFSSEEGAVIKGNFIGNHSVAQAGAITSEGGNIKKISGIFVRNYVENEYNYLDGQNTPEFRNLSYGGAIVYDNCSHGKLKQIAADFIENHVHSEKSPVYAGAISNFYDAGGIMGDIQGDFYRNYTRGDTATAHAGVYAARGDAHLDNIAGNFVENYASSGTKATGGAVYNENSVIGSVGGTFFNNYAESDGSNAFGGAIHNDNGGTIGGDYTDIYGNAQTGIVSASFLNNHASTKSDNKLSLGGAIFTSGDITFGADNSDVIISGNYTEDSRGKLNNAIWVRTNKAVINNEENGYNYEQITPNITLKASNNGKIVINDTIDGGELYGNLVIGKFEKYEEVDKITRENAYNLLIDGDKSGNIYLNNDVINANITLANTKLNLGRESVLNESYLTLNSGTLSMINNNAGVLTPKSFTVNGNTNIVADVDLANQTMDRIETSDYGSHKGNLIVSGMNLISDNPTENLSIYFAQKGLKDYVVNGIESLPDSHQTEVFSPIYRYTADYENRADGGYFVFNRAGLNSSNPSFKYNPSVLATPASAEAGGQSIVNETVRFAFQHADTFSQMPFVDRIAYINQNKSAIADGNIKYSENFEKLNKGVWVKPFTSFESINLKNGPDVDAITYGTLIGMDSNFNKLKNGWYNVHSAYIGYNGSQISYQGVDTSLNGGLLGLTETFYKDNFFSAITATAGASVGTNSTMYGNEDYTMLLGGIGSKTGYNFEFKNGKYILQPIMFMNYSFVNTFDYTNAAGVKMENDPFHTFQINPSIKATANLKNGWQPYASVGFVWNILNSGKVRANNVVLPHMSVDPYVEYGLGLQKHWKDKFTGFAQAMVRNGGRNGVALTFGFRWALGKSEDL